MTSPPQVIAGKQSVPALEPVFVLVLRAERFNVRPGFGRRTAAKVLVRSDVVIEEAELAEGAVQRFQRVRREPVERSV